MLYISWLFACGGNNGYPDVSSQLYGDSDRPLWDPDTQTFSDSSSQVSFEWTPPDEATETKFIQVRLYSDVDGRYQTDEPFAELSPTDTNYTFSGLLSDTKYEFSIVGCLDEICSKTTEISSSATNTQSTSTQREKWVFPGMGSSRGIEFLIPDISCPSVLAFDENPQRILLAYATQNNKIEMAEISRISLNNGSLSIEASSIENSGLMGNDSFMEFTDVKIKVHEYAEGTNISVYASLDILGVSWIGSWTSLDGLLGIEYSPTGGTCSLQDPENMCGMKACVDSNATGLDVYSPTVENMNQLALVYEKDQSTMGSGNPMTMLIQAEHRTPTGAVSGPNLYFAKFNERTGLWNIDKDSYNTAVFQIENATTPSVWNQAEGQIGLYYLDPETQSNKLLYWNAGKTGDSLTYDATDLESATLARTVEFYTANGEAIANEDISIGQKTFFTWNDNTIMLVGITDRQGNSGVSVAYLSNP